MRIPIIAANWKMNLGRADEAPAFVRRICLLLALRLNGAQTDPDIERKKH